MTGFYLADDIISPFIKNVIPKPMGTIGSSFLLIFYIIVLAPLMFVKLEKKETVQEPKTSEQIQSGTVRK